MNAKELVLAKINAGIDMIGLYLYGISIGFTIPLLSEVLMSDAANILQEAMEGNFMQEYKGNDINKIFDYFKWGPSKQIEQFDKVPRSNEIPDLYNLNAGYSPALNIVRKMISWTEQNNPNKLDYEPIPFKGKQQRYLATIKEKLEKIKNGEDNINISTFEITHAITDFINLFSNNSFNVYSKFTKVEFFKVIEQFKSELKGLYGSPKYDFLLNDCIEFIKNFGRQRIDLYSLENKDALGALLVLAIGSKSMLSIGLIASLNQGIPSDLKGFIRKINSIENYIQELFSLQYRLINDDYIDPNENDVVKGLKINLTDIVHNPQSLKKAIDLANIYKVNFNLFHVIETLPDIKEYINSLALIDQYMKESSSRYKMIRDNFDILHSEYNLKNDNLTESISRYMLSIFIQEYLKDETLGIGLDENNNRYNKIPFKFPISKGSPTFVSGQLNRSFKQKSTQWFGLDSPDSIAYFKYWMESKVIPTLKLQYSDIKCLADLQGSSRNNSVSGNEVIAYTLPVDMMAREGSNADLLFKEYLNSFLEMNATYSEEGKTYNVKDLLFYYSLTAFEWKPSKSSLMLLFKTDITRPGNKVSEYFRKILNLELTDLDLLINSYDMDYFMAAKSEYSDPGAKYIYHYDRSTGKRELYVKDENNINNNYNNDYDENNDFYYDQDDYIDFGDIDEEGDFIDYGVKGYNKLPISDPNYYIFGDSSHRSNIPIGITTEELIKIEKANYLVKQSGNSIIINTREGKPLLNISIQNKKLIIDFKIDIKNKKEVEKYIKENFISTTINDKKLQIPEIKDVKLISDYLEDNNPFVCNLI